MTDPARSGPPLRTAFRRFSTIHTRWTDNDVYGHVNNAVHYSWIDSAVNGHLIAAGGLDIHHGSVIGLVVESGCRYFAPIAFPQTVSAGLAAAHVGRSSVRYEVGLFAGDDAVASAAGWFTHVYVGRADRRPHPLPPALLAALETIRSAP